LNILDVGKLSGIEIKMKGHRGLYEIYKNYYSKYGGSPTDYMKFAFPVFLSEDDLEVGWFSIWGNKTLPPNIGLVILINIGKKKSLLNAIVDNKARLKGIDSSIIYSLPQNITELPKIAVFVPYPVRLIEKILWIFLRTWTLIKLSQ